MEISYLELKKIQTMLKEYETKNGAISVRANLSTNCTGGRCAGSCTGSCKGTCQGRCKSGCIGACKGGCSGRAKRYC